MQLLDDIALLREYTEHGSEEAFATLVTRHIDRVYSAALRHTRNPHSAEEITQAVFVILARKSRQLRKGVILAGWLYQTARLTAITHIRGEIRRTRREQEAFMQTELNQTGSDSSRPGRTGTEAWPQISTLLDAALTGLNETDRNAIVLRFFYGKSMGEIGTALGASEDSARMRVNRAIERLRKFFFKRGVDSTASAIAEQISANSIQAAPAALAKTISAIALTKGAAASGSTLTLVKGALKIMVWQKTKTLTALAAATIVAAGTTTLVAQRELPPRAGDLRDAGHHAEISYDLLDDACQFAAGVDQSQFVVRVLISSRNKAVQPRDIHLLIQKPDGRLIPLQLGPKGEVLNFPHDAGLRRENPRIISNQPKGTLSMTLNYFLPMPPNLAFRYDRLTAGVAEANKAIGAADKMIKAGHFTGAPRITRTVDGVVFVFPKAAAKRATVEIAAATGSQTYVANADGIARVRLDKRLSAQDPEVTFSRKPLYIVPDLQP